MSTIYAPLLVKQGDTFTDPLAVADDGGVVNLTGCTLTFHLRQRGGSADIEAIAMELVEPAQGLARLVIPKAKTAELDPGTVYEYEVELTDAQGGVTTPVQGPLFVLADMG